MRLVRDGTPLKSRAFGAWIFQNTLHISWRMYDLLVEYGGESNLNAVALISWIDSFPTTIANRFGWTRRRIARASNALRGMLEPHVHHDVLHPPPRPRRTYGAMLNTP